MPSRDGRLDVETKMISPQKPSSVLAFAIIALLILVPVSTLAQQVNGDDALIIMVNLERIRTQLALAEKGLDAGDSEMAFAHAILPPGPTFLTIKTWLKQVDEPSDDTANVPQPYAATWR